LLDCLKRSRSKMLKKKSLIWLNLLACLLLAASNVGGAYLCIGPHDGCSHIQVASCLSAPCAESGSTKAVSQSTGPQTGQNRLQTDRHCCPCSDVSLSADPALARSLDSYEHISPLHQQAAALLSSSYALLASAQPPRAHPPGELPALQDPVLSSLCSVVLLI
jgi:hypothetical protein